jgi:outer membrane biosynthesis protein TonB
VQGVVVLHATISKTGTIENLTVVSGPAMLQQAAITAVQSWRGDLDVRYVWAISEVRPARSLPPRRSFRVRNEGMV